MEGETMNDNQRVNDYLRQAAGLPTASTAPIQNQVQNDFLRRLPRRARVITVLVDQVAPKTETEGGDNAGDC